MGTRLSVVPRAGREVHFDDGALGQVCFEAVGVKKLGHRGIFEKWFWDFGLLSERVAWAAAGTRPFVVPGAGREVHFDDGALGSVCFEAVEVKKLGHGRIFGKWLWDLG